MGRWMIGIFPRILPAIVVAALLLGNAMQARAQNNPGTEPHYARVQLTNDSTPRGLLYGESTVGVTGRTLNPAIEFHHNLSGTNVLTNGSCACSYNFSINNDSLNTTSPGGPGTHNGLEIDYNMGGSGSTGHRTMLQLFGVVSGADSNTNPSPYFYTGQGIRIQSAINNNGTALSNSGSIGGMNIISQLLSGATYWGENTGLEIDVTIETGASAQYKQGLKIVSYQNDTQRGIGADMAIGISADGGGTATAGFARGLSFGTVDGKWAFTTTSTLIGTYAWNGGANPMVANYGIDLSAVTFSTAQLKMTNWLVDPSGNTKQQNGTLALFEDPGHTNVFGLYQSTAGTFDVIYNSDATNPALRITAIDPGNGLKIAQSAGGSGLALSVLSPSTNDNLAIDAKGTGAITIAPNSTGNVTIRGNNIFSSSGATITGSLNIGGDFAANSGVKEQINQNTAALPNTPDTSFVVQYGGADATGFKTLYDTFGNSGVLSFRRADGTLAAKTQLVASDVIGSLQWRGYDSSNAYSGVQAEINVSAGVNAWSSTDHGTAINFCHTPNASTTLACDVLIFPSGGLGVGSAPTDPGAGGAYFGGSVNVIGSYVSNGNFGVDCTGVTAGTVVVHKGIVTHC